MIKNPIEYKTATAAKVEGFKADDKLRQGFWVADEVTDVKKELKDYYKIEQEFTCPYCLTRYPIKSNRGWDLDHIVPVSNCPLFMFEPHNVCISCIDCNIAKSNRPVIKKPCPKRYPKKTERFRIVHPHFDEYSVHIRRIEPGLYSARTDKGKYTIEYCNLSRFMYDAILGDDTLSRLPQAIEIWNSVMNAKSASDLSVEIKYKTPEGTPISTKIG